jgi:hypothetical protein
MAGRQKPKTGIGFEDDICHFCGETEAAYAREEDGKIYDACFKCARLAKFRRDASEPEQE